MGHVCGRSTRMLDSLLGQKGSLVPYVSNTHLCEIHFSSHLCFRYLFTVSYLQWYQGNQSVLVFLGHLGHLLSHYSHHDLASPLILAALDDPVEEKKSVYLSICF